MKTQSDNSEIYRRHEIRTLGHDRDGVPIVVVRKIGMSESVAGPVLASLQSYEQAYETIDGWLG